MTALFSPYFDSLGLVWAIIIINLWVGTLIGFLGLDLAELSPFFWVMIVLIRTFFHTGLFIVAHDSMHGSLVPGCASLNRGLGQLALSFYAILPYDRAQINHHQHHATPGQSTDPDFHDGIHRNPFLWYLQFLGAYLSLWQMLVFLTIVGSVLLGLVLGCHVSVVNCIFVWMLPLILSSMQLFCFGTYFPHRNSQLQPQSTYYPKWLSFLICYHFSYHQEHHQYPHVAWYRLPNCKS